MSISDLTIKELRDKLESKALSAKEVADFYIDRITKYDKELNSFLTVVDNLKVSGKGTLGGIPIAIKDVIVTKGIRSTGGSKILENYIPPYSATVIKKMDKAGYTLLGKTNCDEFAQGSSNENSAFGPVKNPWEMSRVAGGSSGGSAVAVAADLCHVALGTDTGGSIRMPAGWCGVVGIKPTYGRVSRYGVMAMASSLDQVGVFARRVDDTREVLSVIEGKDSLDCTSSTRATGDMRVDSLEGVRVGVPEEYFAEGLDLEVEGVIRDGINTMKELGAEVKEISLPHSKYALATYYIIMPAEVSSNMGRYDGIRYGESEIQNSKFKIQSLEETYKINRSEFLGEEVKRRIMLGTYVLSAGYYDQYYARAQKVRRLIRQDFEKAFKQVDVIAGPVAPTPAFRLGEKTDDPLQMYLSDIYTVPVNLAGLPALSVPAGFTKDNLPVGMHLIGKWWEDNKLLDIAEHFEIATEHYKKKPTL